MIAATNESVHTWQCVLTGPGWANWAGMDVIECNKLELRRNRVGFMSVCLGPGFPNHGTDLR